MNKLYLVNRTIGYLPDYDVYGGFVISADSEQEARDIASSASADEGGDVWQDPQLEFKVIADTTTEPTGIVLGDFNAA